MRIVGIDPEKLRRATCDNCASIIEFAPREIKTKKRTYHSGGSEIVDTLACPECGAEIQL